jgi:hypothetical protein
MLLRLEILWLTLKRNICRSLAKSKEAAYQRAKADAYDLRLDADLYEDFANDYDRRIDAIKDLLERKGNE